ncbi:MAG: hypothetical protein ABI220_05295 [Candidatus Saccharimonadales bacterium]
MQEIQHWQNIIGHRFTQENWHNQADRESYNPAVTALRLGSLCISSQTLSPVQMI